MQALRLCMFTPIDRDLQRGWPGRIDGDRVVQLAAQTLQSYFTGGGRAREHAEYRLEDVRLLAPVLHPPSLRLFEPDGLRFAFGNPASMYGTGCDVQAPDESRSVEAGVRMAAVIGGDGRIGGFTVMNDWRATGLPPAKDRDFATSLGPVVMTPDELRGDVEVRLRIGGAERWRGAASVPSEQMVEHAARNTRLFPGDLIASGTAAVARVQRSDEVEIDAVGIGMLRNRLAA